MTVLSNDIRVPWKISIPIASPFVFCAIYTWFFEWNWLLIYVMDIRWQHIYGLIIAVKIGTMILALFGAFIPIVWSIWGSKNKG